MSKREKKPIGFGYAMLVSLIFVVFLIVGTTIMHLEPVIVSIIATAVIIIMSLAKGFTGEELEGFAVDNVKKSLPAMAILWSVGAIISSWVSAGTIPALVYYGLEFITPSIFLPTAFILCAIMSTVVGTSWGTVGTMGIVLMGISTGLGFPPAMVAGAIICGAIFGDKMSPVSDSTNLAAIGAGTNLYAHIHSMCYTTIPSALISIVVFFFLGMSYGGGSVDYEQTAALQAELASVFSISPLVLLPAVVMVVLMAMRTHGLVSMYAGVLVAGVIAIAVQGVSLGGFFGILLGGFSMENASPMVATIVNRGGYMSMNYLIFYGFIVISMSGILSGCGYLNVFMSKVSTKIKNHGSLITTALLSTIALTVALADSYSGLLINGSLFGSAFDEAGLDRKVLSRTLEEGATLIIPMVPYSAAAMFYAGTLGVTPTAHIPYDVMLWINPIISIVFAYMGIGLFKKKVEKAKNNI